jgi:hypothetical protein
MLHACLCTICFVFCYTSWRFYAFSGTNLLTRCHNVSSLFSTVFVFQKVTQEIFLELDETKAEPPIFTKASQRPKMRRRGARGQPHHQGARPSPWPRPPVVRPPGPPPDAAPSPIKSPRRKNLRDGSLFHETYCEPPLLPSRDREDPGALLGTLPDRGMHTTMVASGVMCE